MYVSASLKAGRWQSSCSGRSEGKSDTDATSEPLPLVALKKSVYILYLGRSQTFILIKVYCADIKIYSSL